MRPQMALSRLQSQGAESEPPCSKQQPPWHCAGQHHGSEGTRTQAIHTISMELMLHRTIPLRNLGRRPGYGGGWTWQGPATGCSGFPGDRGGALHRELDPGRPSRHGPAHGHRERHDSAGGADLGSPRPLTRAETRDPETFGPAMSRISRSPQAHILDLEILLDPVLEPSRPMPLSLVLPTACVAARRPWIAGPGMLLGRQLDRLGRPRGRDLRDRVKVLSRCRGWDVVDLVEPYLASWAHEIDQLGPTCC